MSYFYACIFLLGCAGGDNDKQAIAWSRRVKTLKRLVLGFTQARPPDPPSLVALDITSLSSVTMRLQEPTTNDSPITTKFKGGIPLLQNRPRSSNEFDL